MSDEIKLFEGNQIRFAWDNEKEEWYFSIVDIIGILTYSKDSGAYWRKLKQRLKEEGRKVVTFCHALKLRSQKDGNIAGNARKEIELETGKPVITSKNAIDFGKLIEGATKEIDENDKNEN